jgi:hypothetical protein
MEVRSFIGYSFFGGITAELTGLPPVSETIVVPNPFDEKLAGGNSGPTICSARCLLMIGRSRNKHFSGCRRNRVT